MPTPSQLDMSVPSRRDADSSFASFPLLPTEIRMQIWARSLQRQRIVTVGLDVMFEAEYGGEPSLTGSV
jgi:hypothetical protein